jgi:hypothetical protein
MRNLQVKGLYRYLRNAVLKDHNSGDVISSIDDMIVTPAMTLAQKVRTRQFTWPLSPVKVRTNYTRSNQRRASGNSNTPNGVIASRVS